MPRLLLLLALLPLALTPPAAAQPNLDGNNTLLYPAPVRVDPGDPVSFAIIFSNTGTQPSPPFEVGIYFSTDRYFSDDDVPAGTVSLPGVGVQQNANTGVTVTTPQVPPGRYYVIAYADHEDLINELIETDNASRGQLTVGGDTRGPDLASAGSALEDDEVAPGGRVTFEYTVRNRGQSAVGDFEVSLYLVPPNTTLPDWILLETETLGGLGPGEADDETEQVTVPASTAPGLYKTAVYVDPRNLIEEPDETNNVGAPGFLTVTGEPPPPAFAVTGALAPNTVAPGAATTLTATVSNASGSSAALDAWLVVLGAAARYEVVLDAGVLGDGATVSRSYRLGVPSGAPAGQYSATLRVGTYPDEVLAARGFPLTVTAAARAGGAASGGAAGALAVEALGGGLFAAEASASGAGASEAVASEAVSLVAWPNPAAGAVTLSYALAEASPVRLAVYDVLGRAVAVVAEGRREAGEHRAGLDVSSLPAGLYLVRIDAGPEAHTRSLTVTR